MLLEIYDIEPFKNFFDLIFDSAQVVELKLDQEKMSISLLNNSHVAFYNVEFKKNFFENYEVNGVESVLVFVEDFYKILKSAKSNDVLTLKTTDSNLVCVFEHDGNRRVFELPLAEDYGDSPVPPSIDYPVEFGVSLLDLKQPCLDLDKIVKTDKFKMNVSGNELNVIAPTDAMTKYQNTIIVDNESSDALTSTYNIQYVLDLQKLSKISKEVVFKFGESIPLGWVMKSVDELVEVSGIVAPIIEENDG